MHCDAGSDDADGYPLLVGFGRWMLEVESGVLGLESFRRSP
ncbi:hypothetical protein SAMN04488548_1341215 [Gordonia westfalica]|uniref:Uncharacterized protein n=1 Tax=Gordonia westfalica TaxID=158898 RepID=A0A1H2IJW8_9ACTN|nr:hypothetical protein SAMN04488548_1341215 [Gordonia westfalica]